MLLEAKAWRLCTLGLVKGSLLVSDFHNFNKLEYGIVLLFKFKFIYACSCLLTCFMCAINYWFFRSYKNGFVWHDLSEDDLVLPAHGNEYVLKGSELLDQSPPGTCYN